MPEATDPGQDELAAALAPRADYKTMQLCREVERTLASVLVELTVVAVEPAPDASRLQVTLLAGPEVDAAAALAAVRAQAGALRSEIAQAVQRKRVPELCFVVIDSGDAS